MNDTPATSPTEDTYSIFVAFHFKGEDNGLPKEGFDSRVIKLPVTVKLITAEDVKEIADAIATSEFSGDKRFKGLQITILSLQRLPV